MPCRVCVEHHLVLAPRLFPYPPDARFGRTLWTLGRHCYLPRADHGQFPYRFTAPPPTPAPLPVLEDVLDCLPDTIV